VAPAGATAPLRRPTPPAVNGTANRCPQMRNALLSLAATALLVTAGGAVAAPYGGPSDPYGEGGPYERPPSRYAESSRDGAGLPGAPGGRGGRSGLEIAREGARPPTIRPAEARLRRYCGDLMRGRSPRGEIALHPDNCAEWFDQIGRSWPAPRGTAAVGGTRGADGAPGPSINGGQGGPGGPAGSGPGAGSGGGGGAGATGGQGGAGGKGGDGY